MKLSYCDLPELTDIELYQEMHKRGSISSASYIQTNIEFVGHLLAAYEEISELWHKRIEGKYYGRV